MDLEKEVTKEKIVGASSGLQRSLAVMLAKSYLLDHSPTKVSRDVFIQGVSVAYGFEKDVLVDAFNYVETAGLDLLTSKNDNSKDSRGKSLPEKGRGKHKKV